MTGIREIDDSLRALGKSLKDCLRDGEHWNELWEKIDALLEERSQIALENNRGTDILEIGRSN